MNLIKNVVTLGYLSPLTFPSSGALQGKKKSCLLLTRELYNHLPYKGPLTGQVRPTRL